MSPVFGGHQGPIGPTKAPRAYPQNFVTELHSIYYREIKKRNKKSCDVFLLLVNGKRAYQ